MRAALLMLLGAYAYGCAPLPVRPEPPGFGEGLIVGSAVVLIAADMGQSLTLQSQMDAGKEDGHRFHEAGVPALFVGRYPSRGALIAFGLLGEALTLGSWALLRERWRAAWLVPAAVAGYEAVNVGRHYGEGAP